MKDRLLCFMALGMLILGGCSKDDSGTTDEFSHIGKWRSYMIEELGSVGEVVEQYLTEAYSITFAETAVTMVIEDMPAGRASISSTYEFKEDEPNIIHFQSAYDNYNLQLVAKIADDGRLALLQHCSDWDYSFVYYFNKM